VRDPSRRLDPWETLHQVGGDYRVMGRKGLEMLRQQGDLTSDDKVLDIGCGNGRMAWPLADALGPDGGYVGFDIARVGIRYCRRRIRAVRPDFAFHHLDIHNAVYNPRGSIPESRVRFPCEDGAITLAFATSVFTHLPMEAIRRYFQETRRVLSRDGRGRALFTAFVLTPQVRSWIAEGRTTVPLRPYRDGEMTIDPRWPEHGLAFDEQLFRAAVEDAGLKLETILRGHWRPEPTYAGGQDLLIVRP
jgi:SAM-dependent methyltransferase